MAYSIYTYAGTGAAGVFTTPEYLDSSHIEVYVDDVLKTVTTHYTITGTTVSFTAGNFPTSSNTIKIIRKSSQSTRLVDYTDGAVEVAATFDEDSKQSLFMAQEALDGAEAIGTVVFQPLAVTPSAPLEGTVYYGASSNSLQFWNGSSFRTVADDATVVKLTGNQTVAGAKSFTSNVAVTGGVAADYIDLTGGESTTTTGTIACKQIILNDPTSTNDGNDGTDLARIYTESTVNDRSSLVIHSADDPSDQIILRTDNDVDVLVADSTGINVTGTVTADGVNLTNDKRITLGSEAGSNYLEIFESTTGNGVIKQVGTGNIAIQGENISLRNDDAETLIDTGHTQAFMYWQGDTGTKGERFRTTETGIDVTGNVKGDSLTIDNGTSFTGAYINSATGASVLTVKSTFEGGTEWQNVGVIEVGGHDKAYIDLKKPDTDDTDLRLLHDGDGSLTAYTGDLLLQTTSSNTGGKVALVNGGNTRLETTATGIDVTGELTTDSIRMGTDQAITFNTDNSNYSELKRTAAGNTFLNEVGSGEMIIQGQSLSLRNEASDVIYRHDANAAELYHRNGNNAGIKLQTTNAGIDVTGTVEADDLKLPLFASTSVATNGSLDPDQVPYASTQDTLALLAVDPSGNVVKGSQEATWTFTKAQLDALSTSNTSGLTLLSAAGAGKAVIVEESNWMIKYSGTGTMSANGFEVRQAHNGASDAGITRIPHGQINTIMSGLPTGNPSYGFYSRDLPQYNNDGRSYVTNKETFLTRINTNATPANLISMSIKLKYRVFDVDTF